MNSSVDIQDDFSELELSIFDFIENIITGMEIKVYDKFNEKNESIDKSESLEKLKSSEAIYVSSSMMEYYLNQMYKNLVEKINDDYMNQNLKELAEESGLKTFSCLNIITNVIMNCYTKLPRSKLELENKDKYIGSVNSICKLMKKFIIYDFRTRLREFQKQKNTKPKNEEDDN